MTIDDGLNLCECGHLRYHHRPWCTDWGGCECQAFVLDVAAETPYADRSDEEGATAGRESCEVDGTHDP